jgi:hypothetical protein
MKIPVAALPIMPAHCESCPFREVNGRWQNIELANQVTERTLFKGQQICHGSEGPNRLPRFRCKGSYDNNKIIYDRMNLGHLLK